MSISNRPPDNVPTWFSDRRVGAVYGALNAKNNWWGSSSGPGGDGPGTGDPLVANGASVTFSPWNTTPAIARESAFTGLAQVPDSLIQAVTFDQGGSNLGYLASDTVDPNMDYRATAVPTETTADAGSAYDVSYDIAGMTAGQWLAYSINVPSDGTYRLDFRVASGAGGGTFHATLDGSSVGGTLTVPNTGGPEVWQTISSGVFSVSAGAHVLTVLFDGNGGGGTIGNLHWLQLTTSSPVNQSTSPITYLSDISWISATAGFGTVQKDKSINGNPLKLRGTTYPKGIGTHAASQIVYNLNGQYTNFASDIGVDDEEVGKGGSVTFQVLGDNNAVLFSSATLTPSSAVVHVNVSVVGVQQLTLVVEQWRRWRSISITPTGREQCW